MMQDYGEQKTWFPIWPVLGTKRKKKDELGSFGLIGMNWSEYVVKPFAALFSH
jgi:hypothetical protein